MTCLRLAVLCFGGTLAACVGEACDDEDGQHQALSLLAHASKYLKQLDIKPDTHAGHEHLPLCAEKVVKQACSSLSQPDHAQHSTHMTQQEFGAAVSANRSVSDALWIELGFPENPYKEVPCMDVCNAAVQKASSFAHMPSVSDMACYKDKNGQAVCDLDLSPKAMKSFVKSGNGGTKLLQSQKGNVSAKRPVLLATQAGRAAVKPPPVGVGTVPYTRKQLLLRLVNLFRIFPLETNASPEKKLSQVQLSKAELPDWFDDVANRQRLIQSRTLLQYTTGAFNGGGSVVLTNFAKYFGDSTWTWNNGEFRTEVLRMLNQMGELLNNADMIPGTNCDIIPGGAAAYVAVGRVDEHGHDAIINVCAAYYRDVELEQAGTLIHELSHQESVGQTDFCRDKEAQWITIWNSQLQTPGKRPVDQSWVDTSTCYLCSKWWGVEGCSGWAVVRYNRVENGQDSVTLECDPQHVGNNCQTMSYGQQQAELLATQDVYAAVRSANNFERFVKDIGMALWT